MRKTVNLFLLSVIFGGVIMLFCGACGGTRVKAEEFRFSETANGKIEQTYEKCIVVYDSYARNYEVEAARTAVEFFGEKKDGFVELVDQDAFSGETENALVVYIGSVDCAEADAVWNDFDSSGYLIYCDESKIVVRGSTAENTYYAVNRLTELHLHGNPNVITNIEKGKAYEETVEVAREDYLANIDSFPAVWKYEWTPPTWIFDFEQKLSDLVAKDGRPMAFAHRGDLECYPENSIEGIISAVLKGADAIEIDCALTSDGFLVLNHGEELNATTDWSVKRGKTVNGIVLPTSNKVNDWTYEQLCCLNLRTGNGSYSDSGSEISDYKIATLEEAFRVCNEKCFLSIDRLHCDLTTGNALDDSQMGVNNPYWPQVHELIRKLNAPRCMLYVNLAKTQEDANALRKIIEEEFNVKSPTLFDRAGWHNSVIEWYEEFSLTTEKEFREYYEHCLTLGSYILSNRLSRVIDWVDQYYANGK